MNKLYLVSSLLIAFFTQAPTAMAAEVTIPALAESQQACKESVQPLLNAIKAAVARGDAATGETLAKLAIRSTALCVSKP